LIYFIFLLLLISFSFFDKSEKYYLIPLFLLFFLSSLRVDAGYDYGSYIQVLNNGLFLALFEPIPLLIGGVASFLNEPQIFFVISSGILLFSINNLIKTSNNKYLFLILYFSLPFSFLDSFGIVRQFIGTSFLVLAYTYYFKNKILSLFYLLLAIFSHKMVLIFFAPLLLSVFLWKVIDKNFKNCYLILIILLALIIYYIFPLIFKDDNIDLSGQIGFKAALFWSLLVVPLIIFNKNYQKKYYDPILLVTVVSIGMYLGLSFYGYFVTRFFAFYAPFVCLFLVRSLTLKFTKNTSIALCSLLSITSLTIVLNGASNNPEFDFLNNYKIYPSKCKNCDIRPDENF